MIIEPASPEHWQELQNAVGRILREAGLEVEIDTPVELVRGQASVDVFARDDSSDPRITYVVECKHWKSAVPQGVVHAFRTIVADCGAHQGFVVSSGGFQSGAYAAAETSNVGLLSWEEFQEVFASRWYHSHALPILRRELDPLVEYTEPINSRVFRKAETLPAEGRKEFIRLRRQHRQLGSVFMIAYFPLLGRSKPVLPPLPLREFLAEERGVRLPDDLMEARTLRGFVDRLVAHARRAIREFNEVFGERA